MNDSQLRYVIDINPFLLILTFGNPIKVFMDIRRHSMYLIHLVYQRKSANSKFKVAAVAAQLTSGST